MNKILIIISLALLIALIWMVSTQSSFAAMYNPDGISHFVTAPASFDYSFKQDYLNDGKEVLCEFTVLNSTSKTNYNDQYGIQIYSDFYLPANGATQPEEFTYNWKQVQPLEFYENIMNINNAVIHFQLSPTKYNPSPNLAVKCSVRYH